jgi:hypothetical protein
MAYMDVSQVMAIPFKEKLAQQLPSMEVLLKTQSSCLSLQQAFEVPVIPAVRLSPAALIVMEALHEAARQVVNDCEHLPVESRRLAQVVWPAIVKFAGKAQGSLSIANLAARVALWEDGSRKWIDDVVRLPDALAASAKLLVHLASQTFSEVLVLQAKNDGENAEDLESLHCTVGVLRRLLFLICAFFVFFTFVTADFIRDAGAGCAH